MSELKFEPGDFDCIVGYHSEDSDRIAKLVNKRIAPLVAENARLRAELIKVCEPCRRVETELAALKAKLDGARVVYGFAKGNVGTWTYDSDCEETHTARLVDIKELAK